jgi:histidinol-phosphate aminotransferase
MSPVSYSPPPLRRGVDLDLSRNEGRSKAADLIGSIDRLDELVSCYPDTTVLRRQLAGLHNLREDHLLVTAGGDDALLRCFLARLGPGMTAVTTTPTFEMIPIYANQVGSHLVEVEWWDGPYPTADVMAAAGEPAVIFVVSPNNPTGSTITEGELRKVSEEAPLVVLDAAYAEFAGDDLTPAALEMGNVVVARTLSKAYGLAGLRVGYLLGSPELIAELSNFGSPYPVSSLSLALATETLGRDGREVALFVDEIRSERTELTLLFETLGLRPMQSQGNFVLAETADARWVADACASLGVGIRRFPDREGLESWVRVTLPGDSNDFERLKRTLTTVLAPEAILFDLDGVLADVSGSYRRSIIETARTFGVSVSEADIDDAKASGAANDDWELTRRLCVDQGVELEYGQVVERFEEIYQGYENSPGLKTKERPLVDSSTWSRWAAKLPLGVVTGRPRSDAEECLERFGLLTNTSVLVAREDAPLKPDPRPVRLALTQLDVRHAWLVGDTPDDIEAARSAQVLPIGVISPGSDSRRGRMILSGAARTLERTMDLVEILG